MATQKSRGRTILIVLLMGLLLVVVGFGAYQLGFQRGVASASQFDFGAAPPIDSGNAPQQFGNAPQQFRSFGGPGIGLSLPWLIAGAVFLGVVILGGIWLLRPAQPKTTVVEPGAKPKNTK
jgi:hypothetical protein